ncbi:MAG: hypothetical protein J7L34_08065 [Thermotogaceae bacterium]|nr:hypothetical protein [Thermotogaceae bacterium]
MKMWKKFITIGTISVPIVLIYGAAVISSEFGNLNEVIMGALYSATQASLSALAADDIRVVNYINKIDHAAILEYDSKIRNLKLDQNRTLHHAKFLLTGNAVVFGSMNFTQSSMYEDLNDAIIFHETDVIKVFEEIFNDLWNGKKPKGVYRTSLGIFYVSPFFDLETVLYRALNEAEKEVDIAVYAFTDMNIFGALKYLSSRSVKVKIAMDDWSEKYIGKHPASQFEVKVFRDITLHHKFMIVDGKLLITGSANFTESAFRKNFEIIFVTKDEGIIQEYKRIFSILWR